MMKLFYSVLFVIVVCSPSDEVVPYVSNGLFLCLSLVSLVFSFKPNIQFFNKISIVFFPLFILLIAIIFSHVKGVLFYNVQVSFNDFSDYLKFILPFLIFLTCFKMLQKGFDFSISIFSISIIYAIFFVLYLIFGDSFIYSLGFGRGEEALYRYGGFIQNPNRYAAIAFLLSAILLCFINKRNFIYFFPVLVLLMLSVLFSQSRTTLIAAAIVFGLYLLISNTNIYYKVLSTVSILFTLLYAFNNFELYWLVADNRFNVQGDQSFGIRFIHSLNILDSWEQAIGFLGIGPAKEEINRLDTVTYLLYYVRYGIIGLLSFVFFHISVSMFFLYQLLKMKYIDEFTHRVFLVNALVAIYVIIANISNEKWIDPQFLTLWFCFIALGFFQLYISVSRKYL